MSEEIEKLKEINRYAGPNETISMVIKSIETMNNSINLINQSVKDITAMIRHLSESAVRKNL